MSRVMFTISYSIKPELREQYLALVKEMKDHFTNVGRKNYAVYEAKGKKNQFTEVFVTNSVEEFDALEDNQDEKTQELVGKLDDFVDNGGMKYTTLVEAL
jgi:L-rhamnose mutarotase